MHISLHASYAGNKLVFSSRCQCEPPNCPIAPGLDTHAELNDRVIAVRHPIDILRSPPSPNDSFLH